MQVSTALFSEKAGVFVKAGAFMMTNTGFLAIVTKFAQNVYGRKILVVLMLKTYLKKLQL